MTGSELENLIGEAKKGLHLENLFPDAAGKQLAIDQSKQAEDARAVAAAWAEFASTPQGQKALEVLADTTLRRASWFVHLGGDAQTIALYGAFREGQNAVAAEIFRQIALGRDQKPPKPRER